MSQDAVIEQVGRSLNRLRGELLGAVESWDVGAVHEAGIKSTIRAIVSAGQDRLVALLEDDPLKRGLDAAAVQIDELERLGREIETEAGLDDEADDRECLVLLVGIVDGRLQELRQHRDDLRHLARVQAELGARR